MKTQPLQSMRVLALAIIALSAAACSKEGEELRSPGKALDDGIAKVEKQSDAVLADMKRGAAATERAASEAALEVKQAALEMRERVGNDLSDAGIVTTVKARLAAETMLKDAHINVDSTRGHLVLRGTVVDLGSIERARQIALAAPGVVAVDNQLLVQSKS